jgi:hypothetical protein
VKYIFGTLYVYLSLLICGLRLFLAKLNNLLSTVSTLYLFIVCFLFRLILWELDDFPVFQLATEDLTSTVLT